MSEYYYLTVFDLWLLIKRYNLNVIFLSYSKSLTKIHYTQLKENKFIANGNLDDQFIHIVIPTFVKNKLPYYSIILDETGLNKIMLKDDMYYLFEPDYKKEIIEYLKTYVKYTIKKTFKKISKKKLIEL